METMVRMYPDTVSEYGISEAGAKAQRTKQIVEAGTKLPKILKDILDQLVIKSNNEFERFRVYGIQLFGLPMTIFVADRPTRYVARIKKVAKLSVSSVETAFKDSVLPLLVTTWMLRQNILKMKQIVANYRNKKRDKGTAVGFKRVGKNKK